jgi:predicted transposase/invertase (TIGR01784 family)
MSARRKNVKRTESNSVDDLSEVHYLEDMARVPAYSDIVFKYLLGNESSQAELMAFVNAVFADKGLPLVSSIEIKKPFNLQTCDIAELIIIDITVVDSLGRTLDIEIQTLARMEFTHRSLYYWARKYADQLDRRRIYSPRNPVICIYLLDSELFPQIEDYHSIWTIQERDNRGVQFSDHLTIHCLEMPKLKESHNASALEKWMRYFTYEGESNMAVMHELLKDNEPLQKVHERYKRFMASDEHRELWLSRHMAQLDYETRMYNATVKAKQEGLEQGIAEGLTQGIAQGMKQGLAQGLEQGIEKGIEKGKSETAMRMLEKGLDISFISDITGLSVDEIEALKRNMH